MSGPRRPVDPITAAADPALTLLLLLPLGLIHLSGWRRAGSAAFGFVLQLLERLGSAGSWLLAAGLAIGVLWAVGRIRLLGLPWRTGALFRLGEGVAWGFLLGPALRLLTSLAPVGSPPLAWAGTPADWHGRLALAAGAGLYEELLFRAGLLAGLRLLLRGFFRGLGWQGAEPVLSFPLALFLSSLAFALAHAWGREGTVGAADLTFLFLAGVLLGVLWRLRGLAVVAYAHAAYDAILLLG
ncbi:MAG: CPBP family intramembrane metalloprotease [Planctomycetota bacterium]|nr:MAG: CPBP family intramembrane metalloprotease [Planctomycetota bacterium]